MGEKQREKQVGWLTDALQNTEKEKQEALEDLEHTREQLEEAEDQAYDLKNQLTGTRRVGVMQRLYLISSKLRALLINVWFYPIYNFLLLYLPKLV